jgi:sugar phosphate isomerase/epimerase
MSWIIGCTTRPYESVTFEEACQHIAAAGYADVAVFGGGVKSTSSAEEVAQARVTATAAGLKPSMLLGGTNLGEGLEHGVDDYKRLIDNAAELGSKWLLDCGTSNETLYADYFELMRRAVPHAQESGVSITMKPHGGVSLTVDDLIEAHQKVAHPAFGICYDPGNIIYYTKGELRPEPFVEAIAPRTTTFIIKDCVVVDGKSDVMVTPGDGWVDFDAVISGLVANGFDGPLYLECVGSNTLDAIDKDIGASLTYVRDILAQC